jgi:hypothetical protein
MVHDQECTMSDTHSIISRVLHYQPPIIIIALLSPCFNILVDDVDRPTVSLAPSVLLPRARDLWARDLSPLASSRAPSNAPPALLLISSYIPFPLAPAMIVD